MPERLDVRLTVDDALGREAARLVDEVKPAGEYHVRFGAEQLPSGAYFYEIRAGPYGKSRHMILLK